MEKPVTFKVNNEQIVGMLHLPKAEGKLPVVIMCHGFSGDKVGPWPYLFVFIARHLAANGFAAFRFDFRGSGESKGKFEDQNIRTELDDLDAAISFVLQQKEIDPERISLLGHSRGGSVSIIKASEDKRIKALVTLAAAANWDDTWKEVAETIKKEGFLEFSNLKQTKQLLDSDFQSFNPITKWAEQVRQPWLIIHGAKDGKYQGEVPIDHAKKLFEAAKNAKLKIINEAGHDFSSRKDRETLFSEITNFLEKNL
jgi:dipeptidyl aminopeptidase/acylaminoacyl peptidase